MTNPPYTLPLWLTDEQALRDEAVLFGLSEARPDEKIASIRLAFSALTAPIEKRIEQHQEAIGDLNFRLEKADAQLIAQQPRAGWPGGIGNWPLLLFLGGLLVSLLLCTGVYLGTFSLFASSQLALVLASLTGLSCCVATLYTCQATHQKNRSVSSLYAQQQTLALKTKLDLEQQKQSETARLYLAEASLNQHNAHRDTLIRLFESEFDLARSLRHQFRDSYMEQ